MTESKYNVNINGWYSLRVFFKVLQIQSKGDQRVAECIDERGNKFFLEVTDELGLLVRSSENYTKTEPISESDIINKLEYTKSVCKVTFLKDNEEERTIVGYTLKPTDKFGRILFLDISDNTPKNINNREIKSLVVNNVKYVTE